MYCEQCGIQISIGEKLCSKCKMGHYLPVIITLSGIILFIMLFLILLRN